MKSRKLKYFSQSQCKQDYFVDQILGGKTEGVFLDIGAYDGVTFSNSYFFEKSRNWQGLCIEPLPSMFKELKKNRGCPCLNGAVTEVDEIVEFTEVYEGHAMLSGVSKYRSDQHKKRTSEDISRDGGKIKAIQVQGYSPKTIFEKYDLKKIDYLSLDIEGGEYEVLKSIDFKTVDITCLTVENNPGNKRTTPLMRKAGYHLVGMLGCDNFYIKKNYFYKILSNRTFNVLKIKFHVLVLMVFWQTKAFIAYKMDSKLKTFLESNKMTRKLYFFLKNLGP